MLNRHTDCDTIAMAFMSSTWRGARGGLTSAMALSGATLLIMILPSSMRPICIDDSISLVDKDNLPHIIAAFFAIEQCTLQELSNKMHQCYVCRRIVIGNP